MKALIPFLLLALSASAQTNSNLDVRVTAIASLPVAVAPYGSLTLCTVSSRMQAPKAYISNLPAAVKNHLAESAELEKQVAEMQANSTKRKAELDQMQTRIQRTRAAEGDAISTAYNLNASGAAPGAYAVSQPTEVAQQQVNESLRALNDYKDQLAEKQKQLRELKRTDSEVLTLRMAMSGRTYAGFPVLICLPQAEEKAKPTKPTRGQPVKGLRNGNR